MTGRNRKDQPAKADDVFPRGDVPPGEGVAGPRPPQRHSPARPPDGWQPGGIDPALLDTYSGWIKERGKGRLWFPQLLIRGYAGDRGERPMWPPNPCWLSPDILLFPAGSVPSEGPVDLSQAVVSPTVGETFTVGVHVWNLGRFPAYGVLVKVWWVEPGFFAGGADPRYTPHFVGGRFVDLGDRDSGRAHDIVLLPQPWTVADTGMLHQCMFAVAECAPDPSGGALDANSDRHVAQRNLSLIAAEDDAAQLLMQLSGRLELDVPLRILVGRAVPGQLAGAAERGMASEPARRLGGPIRFSRGRPIATVTRGKDTIVVRLGRSEGRPVQGLGDALAIALDVPGLTGKVLRSAPDLAGGDGAPVIHLTTKNSGYTIVVGD